MPKNILQDVVPRDGRRSIRNIPLPQRPNRAASDDASQAEPAVESSPELRYFRGGNNDDWKESGRSGFSRWLIWIIGIVSAGVLVAVLGNLFSGATITVTPKSQKISVNADFTAKPNAPAGELSYTPFPIVKEDAVSVPADGEKTVETQATGKIIIYNNYSSVSQRLVKNTRFETPDGLIFKIANSVTVPGRRVLSGQTVPGSVETPVYADSAGSEYNIGLTDFTIPGFKSNPQRYADFYARSKTAMTGGSIGKVKTASDEKTAAGRTELESKLVADLVAEARAALPADSVFYGEAYGAWFEPVLSASSTADKNGITLRERAHFTAYFIKRADLARAIAQNSVDNFVNVPVLVQGDAGLAFALAGRDNPASSAAIGPIQFNLKGDAILVWQVDQNKLAAALAGKNKSELSAVAALDSAILKADAVIRPFWAQAFPKTPRKIEVKIAPLN